ncbi:MAG: HslU--HslV peptidase ATPase subunit [Candidatus Wallbacteria bacterium GWC2_49_35]|uniref:ATP-dependent protease ATPase subunit HslU n=1 Tax=Candidatus Wallbacteria bacterium GWC2_49_35 TaxID=1817813 RepID=A0A1F7X0I3_9BACT|nr:MAG: HslU--HslV peptidase ATPase subunit [Candidatus Wallbacteria bacterium GWC2_49_35]HBC76628.1 HslU--HslV peptidase ATPase subunit [Candidatus Wallbacteria bacterium]
MELEESKLTPQEVVNYLDKYIIGQNEAKKAVAIAVRNRYRRMNVKGELKDEIIPKNIIMIGSTGVGKTEIARRLAKLVNAPFVKVEASKYTEVGYVGRDVESMVRDLVEFSINMVKKEHTKRFDEKAKTNVNRRILDALLPRDPGAQPQRTNPLANIFQAVAKSAGMPGFDGPVQDQQQGREAGREEGCEGAPSESYQSTYDKIKKMLDEGRLETKMIEIEVKESQMPLVEVFSNQGLEEMGFNMGSMFSGMFPERKKKKTVSVADARSLLYAEEINRLIDPDAITKEALFRVENNGIIFIDEIDKIAGARETRGPDVSREGVQRDILPILEGTSVSTKYGPVKTDHILFVAAGAFHISKPSDLIPELQGRFPIRVELKSLTCEDFIRILSEPKNSLIKQYQALLAAENVELEFDGSAIAEIAKIAFELNSTLENIGARRLYTVCEKILESVLFEVPSPDIARVAIDENYVREHLGDIVRSKDLNKYFL